MTNTKTKQTPAERHWVLTSLLFFLGWVFMYADRTILSPVQGVIRDEFMLTNAEVGLISSVFFIIYTAVQIPSGLMGDKWGRTKLICIGFLIFGCATALTGLVTTFAMLLAVRLLAGFGEGFYYGPQYAVSSDSTPAQYRTMSFAIINSGQAAGISLGLIGSSYISFELGLGWRTTFWLYALPTILIGLAIYFFIKEGTHAQPSEKALREDAGAGASVKEILSNRTLATIFLISFCNVYGFFVMVTWLPIYLADVRSIPLSETGMFASLVAWTSIPMALIFARISDRFHARKPLLAVLIPLTIASILTLINTQSWTLMIASLVAYGFVGKLACDPLLLALIADHAPKDKMSTVYGLYNCIAMVGAIAAPYVTGWLRDSTGTWDSGFYFAVGLLTIGWTALWTLKSRHAQPTN